MFELEGMTHKAYGRPSRNRLIFLFLRDGFYSQQPIALTLTILKEFVTFPV